MIIKSMRLDLSRIIKSWYFVISLIILWASLLYSSSTEWGLDPRINDVLYYFWVAHFQSLSVVTVIISGFAAFLICSEIRSKYFYYAAIKTSKKRYAFSKCITNCFSGVIVTFFAEMLFIITLLPFMPLCRLDHPTLLNRIETLPFGFLLGQGDYLLYLFVEIVLVVCRSAVFASIALIVAVFSKNYLITVSSLLFTFFNMIFVTHISGLPSIFNLSLIFDASSFRDTNLSFIYAIIFTFIICLLLGNLSYKKIIKDLSS